MLTVWSSPAQTYRVMRGVTQKRTVAAAVCAGLSVCAVTGALANGGRSLAAAPPLAAGRSVDGFGQGVDFWRLQLTKRSVLTVQAQALTGAPLALCLMAPKMSDAGLRSAVPCAAQGGTYRSSWDREPEGADTSIGGLAHRPRPAVDRNSRLPRLHRPSLPGTSSGHIPTSSPGLLLLVRVSAHRARQPPNSSPSRTRPPHAQKTPLGGHQILNSRRGPGLGGEMFRLAF